MKGWSVIYKTPVSARAAIVKGVLAESGIEAVIMNKKDSTLHIDHGQLEVMVPSDVVLKAVKIVNDEIAFR